MKVEMTVNLELNGQEFALTAQEAREIFNALKIIFERDVPAPAPFVGYGAPLIRSPEDPNLREWDGRLKVTC